MMSYFGLILAFATRYDRKLGIGTLMTLEPKGSSACALAVSAISRDDSTRGDICAGVLDASTLMGRALW